MIHGVVLLALCLATDALAWAGVAARWPYPTLWTAVMGPWAAAFWQMRRNAGPITFVEWKVFHLWVGPFVAIAFAFFLEAALGLPVLSLSPLIAVAGGSVFLAKAAMFSGGFYAQAAALYLTAAAMPFLPGAGMVLLGAVAGASFFVPGLRQHRRRG